MAVAANAGAPDGPVFVGRSGRRAVVLHWLGRLVAGSAVVYAALLVLGFLGVSWVPPVHFPLVATVLPRPVSAPRLGSDYNFASNRSPDKEAKNGIFGGVATLAHNELDAVDGFVRHLWIEPAQKWDDEAGGISGRAEVGGSAENQNHPNDYGQEIFEEPGSAHRRIEAGRICDWQ